MRAPLPVSVEDASAGAGWRGAQTALYALAAAALAAWTAGHLGWWSAAWVVALSCAVGGGALGWALSRAPVAGLRWTGAQWLLRVGGAKETPTAPPAVMLDFGAWVLLRCSGGDPGRRWLAVSRSGAGAEWPPFRAAVYSNVPGLSARFLSQRPPF